MRGEAWNLSAVPLLIFFGFLLAWALAVLTHGVRIQSRWWMSLGDDRKPVLLSSAIGGKVNLIRATPSTHRSRS